MIHNTGTSINDSKEKNPLSSRLMQANKSFTLTKKDSLLKSLVNGAPDHAGFGVGLAFSATHLHPKKKNGFQFFKLQATNKTRQCYNTRKASTCSSRNELLSRENRKKERRKKRNPRATIVRTTHKSS